MSRWFYRSNRDLIDGVLFMFLSVLIFFISAGMDGFGNTVLSPGTFPAISAGVLFFLALNLFFKSFKTQDSDPGQKKEGQIRWRPVLVVTLICLVYVWVLPILHFVVSTMFFLVVFLFYIGERRIWMVAMVSVSTTFVIYFIFGNMLKVLLP